MLDSATCCCAVILSCRKRSAGTWCGGVLCSTACCASILCICTASHTTKRAHGLCMPHLIWQTGLPALWPGAVFCLFVAVDAVTENCVVHVAYRRYQQQTPSNKVALVARHCRCWAVQQLPCQHEQQRAVRTLSFRPGQGVCCARSAVIARSLCIACVCICMCARLPYYAPGSRPFNSRVCVGWDTVADLAADLVAGRLLFVWISICRCEYCCG